MHYKVLIAAVLVSAVVRGNELNPPPERWGLMPAGGGLSLPGACDTGIDADMAAAGQPNMTIRCNNAIPSFGGLRHSFQASPYWGKRIRFSAWLKADGIREIDGIDGAGGLFIAVPSPIYGPRTNSAPERALKGWTDWEYRDFVVDIPEGGQFVVIGFWMRGQGQIWIRDIDIEVVPDSVPVNLAFDDNPESGTQGPDLSLE